MPRRRPPVRRSQPSRTNSAEAIAAARALADSQQRARRILGQQGHPRRRDRDRIQIRGEHDPGPVVEVDVDGAQLRELDRTSVRMSEPVSRVLPTEGGWALLGGTSMAFADDEGHAGPVVTI